MNWPAAIGIISSLALFLPVIIIIFFGFFRYKNYLALLIYCLLALVYNLMTEDIIATTGNIEKVWGIVNNLLDVPLMLLFMMIFSTSATQTFRMKIYLAVFVFFEIIVISIYGLNIKTITIVMGPGLALILVIGAFFFVMKVKQSIIHKKALGKAFLTAAIVFAYGCFSFIYIMHYILALDDISNIFLIYHLVTIVYCSLLATGLIIEKKRVKKLGELRVTRKELMQFFNDEKKPSSPPNSTNAQWKLN